MITTGGDKENYCETGSDRYTIVELLEPFNQTAKVCNMMYLPPFVVHGTHNMATEDYEKNGLIYGYFLHYLENNYLDKDEILQYQYLNEWFATILT